VLPVPGIDRLSLLPAGRVPQNPAELLDSPRARDIFTRLRDQYDLVLIDSPPVLPVTDAAILSRHADATLMLAAAGQTRRSDLHRAVEKLGPGRYDHPRYRAQQDDQADRALLRIRLYLQAYRAGRTPARRWDT
jgi:hypothetical protein